MSTSAGDNSTVVGDRDTTFRKDQDFSLKDHSKGLTQAGTGTRLAGQDILSTGDYTVEDRPFFFPIGKAGLIAALQKLDGQLVEVRALQRFRTF